MKIYEENFTVRYSEVDRNNTLTPISIMQYFQEIGCLHSDHVAMGLKQKAAWIIIQWKVKILSKAGWNDKITVKTWPSGIQGPYCFRDYEMYKGDELIAIGTSKWVLTDIITHKLLKITDDIVEKFTPQDKQVFSEPLVKLKPMEDYTDKKVHKITLKDIDTNQHVNNIRYIELACDMLPNDPTYIEVMYKHSSVFGEELDCYYKDEQVTIKNGDRLSAIVKFKPLET